MVSALLKAGAKLDVNVRSGEELWSRASRGHEYIAKLLFIAGEDVNSVDSKRNRS